MEAKTACERLKQLQTQDLGLNSDALISRALFGELPAEDEPTCITYPLESEHWLTRPDVLVKYLPSDACWWVSSDPAGGSATISTAQGQVTQHARSPFAALAACIVSARGRGLVEL